MQRVLEGNTNTPSDRTHPQTKHAARTLQTPTHKTNKRTGLSGTNFSDVQCDVRRVAAGSAVPGSRRPTGAAPHWRGARCTRKTHALRTYIREHNEGSGVFQPIGAPEWCCSRRATGGALATPMGLRPRVRQQCGGRGVDLVRSSVHATLNHTQMERKGTKSGRPTTNEGKDGI